MQLMSNMNELINAACSLGTIRQALATAAACDDFEYRNQNQSRLIEAEDRYAAAYFNTTEQERREARLYTNAPIVAPPNALA